MRSELYLDLLGEVCPYPLVIAKQRIQEVAPGGRLIIDFDCNQATESLPRWAQSAGHLIESFEKTGPASWRIVIRRQGTGSDEVTPEDYTCAVPKQGG
ncbi:MAG: sulfurtransferase TusA family protein [Bacillota bacterium]|nr:sulfurtransferase TusA family protein [Bacillota bacterium]PZN37788.1 MAG: oxidoreductase [Bacillota bacterium]